MLRRPSALLLVAAVTSSSTLASAADPCNKAFEDADVALQPEATRLLDARRHLQACAAPTCKDWMVSECSKRLLDVERRIPTVVFVARSRSGGDLVDVAVRSGDQHYVSRLDGRSVDVDPGVRVFTFITPDGRRLDKQAVIREGEKSQRVSVEFDAPDAPAMDAAPRAMAAGGAPPSTTPSVGSDTGGGRAPSPSREDEGSTQRTLGFVSLGAGVLGLGVGTALGFSAKAKYDDAKGGSHCGIAPNGGCDAQGLRDVDSARAMGNLGTGVFIAGAAFSTLGVVLWLLAPRSSAHASARLGGSAAPGGGQIVFEGRLP